MNRASLLRQPCAQFTEGVDYRVTEDGCWEWLGGFDGKGYGRVYSRGHDQKAHRESYIRAIGSIPVGWHIHHKCENKACIRPDHLEALGHSAHLTLHKQIDSTLTWDDVHAIRDANKAGVGIYEQAERYGLRISTLQKLIAGETWIDPDYVPGAERECPECGETFRTTHVAKRFCCVAHRSTWNSRRTGRRSRGQAPDGSQTRGYSKRAA